MKTSILISNSLIHLRYNQRKIDTCNKQKQSTEIQKEQIIVKQIKVKHKPNLKDYYLIKNHKSMTIKTDFEDFNHLLNILQLVQFFILIVKQILDHFSIFDQLMSSKLKFIFLKRLHIYYLQLQISIINSLKIMAQITKQTAQTIQITKIDQENIIHSQQLCLSQNTYIEQIKKNCDTGIPTLSTEEKEEGLMEDLDLDDIADSIAKIPSPTKICVKISSISQSENFCQVNVNELSYKAKSNLQQRTHQNINKNAEETEQKEISQQEKQFFLEKQKTASNKQPQHKINSLFKDFTEQQTKINNKQNNHHELLIDKKFSNQQRLIPQKLSDQIEFDFETVSMTSKSWLSNSEICQNLTEDVKKQKKIENEQKQTKIIDDIHSCKSISQGSLDNDQAFHEQAIQDVPQIQNNFSFYTQSVLLKTAQKQRLILAYAELNKHFTKYQNVLNNHQILFDYYLDRIKIRYQSKRDLFSVLRTIIVHRSSSFAQTHNYMVNNYTGKIYHWDGLRKKSIRQGQPIQIVDSQEDLDELQKYQNAQQNPYLNMGKFYSTGYKQLLNVRKEIRKTYDELSKKLYGDMLQKLKTAFDTYEKKHQNIRAQSLQVRSQFIQLKIRFLTKLSSMKSMGQKLKSNFQSQRDLFLEIVQFFNKEDQIQVKLLSFADAMNKFRKLSYQLEKQLMQQILYIFKEYRQFSQENYISVENIINHQPSQKLTVQDYVIFLQSELENSFSFENILSEKHLKYLQELYNAATCSEQNCIIPAVDYQNEQKYQKAFMLQNCLFKMYLKRNCISVRQLLKFTLLKTFLLKDPSLQMVISLKNQLILIDWEKLTAIETFTIEELQMEMEIFKQQLKQKEVSSQKIQQQQLKSSQTSSDKSPIKEDAVLQKIDPGTYNLILRQQTKNIFSSNLKQVKVEFASMDKLQQFIIIIQNWKK